MENKNVLHFPNGIDRLEALGVLRNNLTAQEIRSIDEPLQSLVVHVVGHTTPISGSSIKKFKGLFITEIAERMPDMPLEDMDYGRRYD